MCIGCVAVLIAALAPIEEVPELVRDKLSSTNLVSGAFVQTKRDTDGTEYVTRGNYSIEPGVRFTWKTVSPFETEFIATPTNYVYANEDETVGHPLKDLPEASRLESVVKGDYSAFFKAFDATWFETNGTFQMHAVPKVKEIKRGLVAVDASGTVSNWVLRATFPSGVIFSISFTDN